MTQINVANSSLSPEEERAYIRWAAEKYGTTFDPHLFPQGNFPPISGHSAVRSLPCSGIPIDGISAANGQTSIAAIKELLLRGCPPVQ